MEKRDTLKFAKILYGLKPNQLIEFRATSANQTIRLVRRKKKRSTIYTINEVVDGIMQKVYVGRDPVKLLFMVQDKFTYPMYRSRVRYINNNPNRK